MGKRVAMLAALGLALPAAAVPPAPNNVDLPAGGDGFVRTLPAPVALAATADWTLAGWVRRTGGDGPALVGGVGSETPGAAGAFLVAGADTLGVWDGQRAVTMAARLGTGWHAVAAVAHAGVVRVWLDGRPTTLRAPAVAFTSSRISIGPRGTGGFAPFAGRVAGFGFAARALAAGDIAALAAAPPDERLIRFDSGSPTWPVQLKNMPGLTAPQDPATLPHAAAAADLPAAVPAYAGPALVAGGPRHWTLPKWTLLAARDAGSDGARLSRPGSGGGLPATVPGTVLTTLVDRGVYPDPAHGLANMAIPDDLGRQDWWYRTEFDAPADRPDRLRLTFAGINYLADVWLNGERLGAVRGAFTRGSFDVSRLRPRGNVLAVLIHPPLHPGTPHEQSLAAGVGPNGGLQALDGPTFFATEGWDWIPGVRDRNIGLWQEVTLDGSGPVRLGDPEIVTQVDTTGHAVAEVEIDVAVENDGSAPVATTVAAAFDDVAVARQIVAAPGETVVRFTPADFPQLRVQHPRLWWPNGYGAPALHTAHLTLAADGRESDARDVRFGMRQMTYELSLMAPDGRLRRVEVDFARARQLGQQVVDPRHEGVRKVAGGWVNSLTAVGAVSPAVRDLTDTRLTPYLVIKVNGVRIAARGGSWGMDDFMKRSARDRLEPYFRLHRDAGVNIIRNWVGQNTEPAFYDLADEYGMLITNDFWASTQDYQMEPEDVGLFLANAEDTIRRYRNHPSIALWFGRNEGVPPRLINEGLERLTRTLDGTRWYTGSSNSVNLWVSGPYDYRAPASYFTDLAKGFSVEVGSQSFPTLEAFEAMVPPADRWPISDSWAYHDWHQDGNGDTHGFMAAMTARLGPPRDLADFERKAQLMNFDTFRAIMEGLNAGLWTTTSGRMLWMTQPAWPSTMWQLYSHDYDTHAAFYAFKSAAEPIHVQLTLPDHRAQLVNNRQEAVTAHITATVMTLGGAARPGAAADVTVPAGQVADVLPSLGSALTAALATDGALVVALDARADDGTPLSHNLYWLADSDAGWHAIAAMAAEPVAIAAADAPAGDGEGHITVTLTNAGEAPALEAKLTLLGADGQRILPAYYSDNYVSLLPHETRRVTIAVPATARPASVALRGWNVAPARAMVAP